MRYAIQGATKEQVKAVGALNIQEAPHTHIIFADLSNEQVVKLKAQGALVNIIGQVKATIKSNYTITSSCIMDSDLY